LIKVRLTSYYFPCLIKAKSIQKEKKGELTRWQI